jgi:hypothetical protein
MIGEKRTMDRPCTLSLVCADDRKEAITFQERISSLIPVNEAPLEALFSSSDDLTDPFPSTRKIGL